ncbi:MAG: 3-beta hydroxysteroid dehydrogenase, partial [bacterium]
HLIWGPGDSNLIHRLIKKGKSGRLTRVGDGSNLIGITYIDNAVQAHLLAADRLEQGSPVCGQAYFITQAKPVNLWDWVNELFDGLGIPPPKRSISYKSAHRLGAFLETLYTVFGIESEPPMTRFLASQLARPHYFNISKAIKELGYRPEVDDDKKRKYITSLKTSHHNRLIV